MEAVTDIVQVNLSLAKLFNGGFINLTEREVPGSQVESSIYPSPSTETTEDPPTPVVASDYSNKVGSETP